MICNWGCLWCPTIEWENLENKDLPRTFCTFLWKMLYNAHKVGEYWENIPNWEHRSVCNQCDDNSMDNFEHIMLSCRVAGQKQIWWLVREVWEKRNPNTWPRMNNIGSLTRCALANFKMKEGKPKPGDNHLYKILIAELAVLIWHLRNQRICKKHLRKFLAYKRRSKSKMDHMRLTIDCALTQKNMAPSPLEKIWSSKHGVELSKMNTHFQTTG